MIQGHGDDGYRYGQVRMNFSSNIYAHADLSGLKAHLASMLDLVGQYPEPEPYALERLIAEHRNIPSSCVIVTNGATEAIYLVAQMLRAQGVMHYRIQHPTFSEYEDACRMYGMTPGEGGVTWICNPNNPTGQVTPIAKGQLPKANSFLVIDQSYEDFCLKPLMSAAEAVDRGNVIQIHSLTKTYAVPGLRIGYVVSSEKVICQLRAFVRPWSVNALAIEAGKWLIANDVRAVPDVQAYLAATDPAALATIAQSLATKTAAYQDGAETRYDMPALLSVAVGYAFEKNVRATLEYHFFDDKNAKMANNRQEHLTHGTHEFLAGIEGDVNDRWTLSCGVQRTDYGISDDYEQNTSFACDSYSIGLGAAVKLTDKVRLNAGYFCSIYDDYQKTCVPTRDGYTGSETYSRTNHVIGLGVDFKF